MRKWIEDFLRVYLGERDLAATLAFFSENVIDVGTGKHETAIGKAALQRLFEEEIAALPNPFTYEILNYAEMPETPDTRNLFVDLRVTMMQDAHEFSAPIRFTASCIREKDTWYISCIHISSPSEKQEDGSFFPLHYGAKTQLSTDSEVELVQLVMETLSVGIMGNYLEEGFPFYLVNDKMLDILGYTYEELLAASDRKILHLIAAEDRERTESEIYRQLQEEGKYEVEYRILRKNKQPLWIRDIGRKFCVDSGREVIIGILSDITERMERELAEQEAQRKMQILAYTDSLTGMGNRTAFHEKLMEFSMMQKLGCVVADINNLKICNDKYGHEEGDHMLMDAADCIRDTFAELGVSYRIGGDEFCVLIPNGGETEILQALERVHQCITEKNKKRTMPLFIAFGYAIREGLEESVETLFNRADEMMYDVKHRMKHEFPVYREEKISNYLNVLRVLQKSMNDYLFLWDIGRDEFWYFSEIDQNYAVHIGDKPTVSAQDLERIIYPADRAMLYADLSKVAAGKQQTHDLNYRWINKKGEPVWVNCRGRLISDDKGRPFCMIGRVSDQMLRYLYNPLTRLFNKEKMVQDFETKHIADGYFVLLSIDNLNATKLEYGRNYGEQVIKKCAEILESNPAVRYIWHIENHCFALYLDTQEEKEVQQIYDGMSAELLSICTISAGAVPDRNGMFEYIHDLYACAGLTLDKAKAIGDKTLLFYSEKELEERKKSVQLFEELRCNIQNGCRGFSLHYQPLFFSGNYQVYGAEALLRYRSEEFGALTPDEFIPLLEQSGLIRDVGLWVLEKALLQCREWRKCLPNFHINVNFSAVQLKESCVAERVLDILEKTAMPGDALTIELTESIQLHGIEHLKEIFQVWRNAGIELAIDDFGTGYASLSYLKELNFHEIKIARLFVDRIERGTYNYRLISNMIDFAKNNDIRVCCEGVEHLRELAVLEGLAPNIIQGFLLAKPCKELEFEQCFLNRDAAEYQAYANRVQEIYQYKSKRNVMYFDARDILRETDVGLWIIRINEAEGYYELNVDETMERILGVERKYTPTECYEFWFSRIRADYVEYVRKNVQYIMKAGKVVQLQYPWMHPQLGEVIVRCSGKSVADSDGMVTLKGYHRIISDIEEINVF